MTSLHSSRRMCRFSKDCIWGNFCPYDYPNVTTSLTAINQQIGPNGVLSHVSNTNPPQAHEESSVSEKKLCKYLSSCILRDACPNLHPSQMNNDSLYNTNHVVSTDSVPSVSASNSLKIPAGQKACKYGAACDFQDNCSFYHPPKAFHNVPPTSAPIYNLNRVSSTVASVYNPNCVVVTKNSLHNTNQVTSTDSVSSVSAPNSFKIPVGQKACKYGAACDFKDNCGFYHSPEEFNNVPPTSVLSLCKVDSVNSINGSLCKVDGVNSINGSLCKVDGVNSVNDSFCSIYRVTPTVASVQEVNHAAAEDSLYGTNHVAPAVYDAVSKASTSTSISSNIPFGQKPCKYGAACNFKDNCSFYHSPDDNETASTTALVPKKPTRAQRKMNREFTLGSIHPSRKQTNTSIASTSVCTWKNTKAKMFSEKIFQKIHSTSSEIRTAPAPRSTNPNIIYYTAEVPQPQNMVKPIEDVIKEEVKEAQEVTSASIAPTTTTSTVVTASLGSLLPGGYIPSVASIEPVCSGGPIVPPRDSHGITEKPPEKACKYGTDCIDMATCPFYHPGRVIPPPRVPKMMSLTQWFEMNYSQTFADCLYEFLNENNVNLGC